MAGTECVWPRDTARILNVKHVRARVVADCRERCVLKTRASVFLVPLLWPFSRLFVFIPVRRTKINKKRKHENTKKACTAAHNKSPYRCIIVRQRQKFVCFDTCGSEGVSHKVIRTLCKSYYGIIVHGLFILSVSLSRHFGTRIIIACVQVLWRC